MYFDFANNLIEIESPAVSVDMQDLINAIRTEESGEQGIVYDQIAEASGKEFLGEVASGSVSTGITVNLLDSWQLHFWSGSYTSTISGGNLVGGLGGNPIAYTAGVQVLLIRSAASTIATTGGSALTGSEHTQLMALPTALQGADALLDRANAIETGLTPRGALRLVTAASAGELSGAATDTVVIKNAVADDKTRITAVVDSDGNRTAVTTDTS